MKCFLACFLFLTVLTVGCATVEPVPHFTTAHRYFVEVDRPGSIYSVLENPDKGGAMLRVQEIDEAGRPLGDTLQAWVQHYSGRKKFDKRARDADIVIACHRELQPEYAQALHVLPESTGEIFVYMMQGGIIIISDQKISYYEVLIAARKAR